VAAVRHARSTYAHRRHLVVEALNTAGVPVPPGDGLNIWLPVADEQSALISLASAGIAVAAGASFTPSPCAPHLRVTVGLITVDHAAVAARLAAAARSPLLAVPR
jgi:DNA-binding transcriptional MocR family regulator